MYEDLIEWIRNNNGYIHSSLYIDTAYFDNIAYSSVYCKNDKKIEKKTQLTKIPHNLIISEDTFNKIPNIKNCSDFIKDENTKLKVVIALLYETIKKEDSFYHPYIKSLPKFSAFDKHPIYIHFLNSDAFNLLEPLSVKLTRVVKRKSKELAKFIDTILLCNKEVKIFNDNIPADELKKMIIWSFFILTTRSWGNKLIPFNDSFNHEQNSNISLDKSSSDDKSYSFFADNQFTKKQAEPYEVFINYGHYALMSLQMYYGFLPQNDTNYLRIDFALKSDDEFEKLKIQEVAKCDINNRKVLLSNSGPSREFVSIMRIMSLDESEYKQFSEKSSIHKYRHQISNKNELKSIKFLLKVIQGLKKSTYNLEIMKSADEIMSSLKNKKSLSPSEDIIQNICLIKTKEYAVIEDSLNWADSRLLKIKKPNSSPSVFKISLAKLK